MLVRVFINKKMSTHRSYFNKNNTIIFNSLTNTGRNPVAELFYGSVDDLVSSKGFSRFIFALDLTALQTKIQNNPKSP